MSRTKEAPTETRDGETVVRKHPAFGMIGANRTTGGASTLFGSPLKHNNTIRITIMQAEERLDLHREWHYANKIVAEVELSEAQWATFVSAMNVGHGVPCTIMYMRSGKELEVPPQILDESFVEKRERDIKLAVARDMDKLQEAYRQLQALAKAKTITKSALEPILSLMLQAVGHAPSNYAFATSMVSEHVEQAVVAAKAEVIGFVTQLAARYPALTEAAPVFALDAPEGKNEKDETGR